MGTEEVLKQVGLSEGEVQVYTALLKLGRSPVREIKEQVNMHRTTVYDHLDTLQDKGLVNYVVENNVKYFNAADPQELLEFLKEKESEVKSVMPDLEEMKKKEQEEIKVEVYRGREGLKTIFNDIKRKDEDLVAFGVDDAYLKENYPVLMKKYVNELKKADRTERILASEETRHTYEIPNVDYRYVPKEFFNPTMTMVYSDRVVITVRDPFTHVMMENEELADAYRKHFEMLWSMAKEKQE